MGVNDRREHDRVSLNPLLAVATARQRPAATRSNPGFSAAADGSKPRLRALLHCFLDPARSREAAVNWRASAG
jgi:hypothetical protein